jgi:ketosteroid isomerase-like protein
METTPDSNRAATDILTKLNQEYVDAFMNSDADWYRDHLAEDFVCIQSDGSMLGKAEFLRNAARGPDVASYELLGVRVRMFGEMALVHAIGRFTRTDGSAGKSRYTDVWALQDGRWRTIAAQITRTYDSSK